MAWIARFVISCGVARESDMPQAPTMLKNVEARQNAYNSLPQIVANIVTDLNQRTFQVYAAHRFVDLILN